jgi:hypothetical protein
MYKVHGPTSETEKGEGKGKGENKRQEGAI